MKRLPLKAWTFLRSTEARTLIAIGALAAAAWAFLALSDEVSEDDTLPIDRAILMALRTPGDPTDPIGPKFLEEVVRDITALGGLTQVTIMAAVLAAWLLLYRRRREALVFAATVVLASVSSEILKALYGRERPSLVPHEIDVYSHSFPSGHSTVSAATFLTAAVVLAGLQPARGGKRLAFTTAILLVAAVGISRIYLGVHWPSDVLGGWALGAAWALAAHLALRLTDKPRAD